MLDRTGTVVLLASDLVGQGDDELGALLMRSFLKTLVAAEVPPDVVVCVNGGVRLTIEGSPVLSELAVLAGRGASVLSCGTCLDWFHAKEKLLVGEPTNMATIVGLLSAASRVIRP